MIHFKIRVIGFILAVLFFSDSYAQVEQIARGQFEYAITDVRLGGDSEISAEDSVKMIGWLSDKFNTKIYFNADCVAIVGKNGNMDTRMVFTKKIDSVYLFIESFGEKSVIVTPKDEFTKAIQKQMENSMGFGGIEIDTLAEDNIGVNADGIDIVKVVVEINGKKSVGEYATNIMIDIPFPVHRAPFLSDKILTKFEMLVGDEMITFGSRNFQRSVADESIFNVSLDGFRRRER